MNTEKINNLDSELESKQGHIVINDSEPWYVERWFESDLIDVMQRNAIPVTRQNIDEFKEICRKTLEDKTPRFEAMTKAAYNYAYDLAIRNTQKSVWEAMQNPAISEMDFRLQNDWNIHAYFFRDTGKLCMQVANTRTDRFLPGTYYLDLNASKDRLRKVIASVYFSCAAH